MRIVTAIWVVFIFASGISADEAVDYKRDVRPLLTQKCAACHGAFKQESGLRLDVGVLIRQGSDNGKVVLPGNAAESPIIHRVAAADLDFRMPPQGEGQMLNSEQIALLSAWISQGASIPDEEVIPADPREHWAYQRPVRSPLPEMTDSRWSHPIDAFISDGHRQLSLSPVDVADRYTLLRRLHLDLTGLPPTRLQIQMFANEQSAGAWIRVVDQLLDSPHYGERWGRHWMDVWRYSDWDGFQQELRSSQRHIWRWRDWIVQSLNVDKGYDRMIMEMLAGDEIAPADRSVLAATGFLARNFHKSNRNIWLDATVEHTSKAFLGTTLNCARCHDHKYDPIAQQEYYRFRAIFEPHRVRIDRLPRQPDLMKDGLPRAFDSELVAETYLYVGGNEKHPDKENPLPPAVPAVIGGEFFIDLVELPLLVSWPSLREFAVDEDLSEARMRLEQVKQQLAQAHVKADEDSSTSDGVPTSDPAGLRLALTAARLRLQSLEARLAADRAKSGLDGAAADDSRKQQLASEAMRLERDFELRRAELTVLQKKEALACVESDDKQDEKKKAAAVAALKRQIREAEKAVTTARETAQKSDVDYTPVGPDYPRTSSGRRLALARWITSAKNPLTARVAVNHIWMRHFGKPLVENVFDFGLRSPRPVYGDLLDWLAVELMENGWSMKHLHRLILTSRTWRLASSAGKRRAAAREIDPDNQNLWKANVRRMDAEIIRDSVLAVSGQLDPALGGPETGFQEADASVRRSLYVQHAYEKQATMLVLFDAASPNECYRRSESIIPQQALALANSSLALSQSRQLARLLSQEVDDFDAVGQAQFVEQAFLHVLSRPPSAEEASACVGFLWAQAETLSEPTKLTTFSGGAAPTVEPAEDPLLRARENLVHVFLNHNDFITIR